MPPDRFNPCPRLTQQPWLRFRTAGSDKLGEGRVVDVVRHADQLPVGGLVDGFLKGAEQGLVGLWDPEGLPRRVEGRNPALGQQEADHAVHPVQLFADEPAYLDVSLDRGAHEGDLRVVLVEQPPAVAFGHGLGGVEIHHVQRPASADIGLAAFDHRVEAGFVGGKDAAGHHVADLGGGQVALTNGPAKLGATRIWYKVDFTAPFGPARSTSAGLMPRRRSRPG